MQATRISLPAGRFKAKNIEVTAAVMVPLIASEPTPVDVSNLIRDLGSDKYRVRAAARKKLLAAGPGAIPALKKATKSSDAEVSYSAKLILGQLGNAFGFGKALGDRLIPRVRILDESVLVDFEHPATQFYL